MKLRKVLVVMLLVALIMLLGASNVKAATPNDEIYSYFENTTFTVLGEKYKANADQLGALEKYLNTHTLTEEQVSVVKGNVEKAISEVNSDGAGSVSKLKSSTTSKVQGYVDEVENSLGVTIKYLSASNSVSVVEGNTPLVVLQMNKGLVQTGHTYVPYIVVSVLAIVAIAMYAIVRKNNAK